jgi:C-terminal domain found in long catalases
MTAADPNPQPHSAGGGGEGSLGRRTRCAGPEVALAAVGFPTDDPGVVIEQDATRMLDQVVELLAEHRVWHRFPVQVG